MNNNEICSIEKVLKIINSHTAKSILLKNYFLRNMNKNEVQSQILGYLDELEYDLRILTNLIEQFQLSYCNIIQNTNNLSIKECNLINEINRLNLQLNNSNEEIINLQHEINCLKNNEYGKVSFSEKIKKSSPENKNKNELNITYNEMNKYNNYSNFNSGKIFNNDIEQQKNGLDYKNYGRLTYIRTSNEEKNIKNNKILNKNKNKYNNNIKNKFNEKINKNFNKSVNNSEKNIIPYDMLNLYDNNNINNKNFNNYSIRNTINNKDIIKNINPKEDIALNLDFNQNLNYKINSSNNSVNYLIENKYPKEEMNYNNFNIQNSTSAVMKSKRIPKYRYKDKNFSVKLSDIPREKNNKINRINNILFILSNDENKANELKSIFGNNIQAQLINGDINSDYLEKIENILCYMKVNKSIIPTSKRFQIQNRAKSNSVRKNNDTLNNNRFIRQKLRDKTFNNINKKNKINSNTSRDFYINN